MDSLTKENFWNALMEKYPVEMKMFCEWIDEYKKSVDWFGLFGAGYYKGENEEIEFRAPKYHDLPIAMQMGIFSQWMNENQERDFGQIGRGVITQYFFLLNEQRQIDSLNASAKN